MFCWFLTTIRKTVLNFNIQLLNFGAFFEKLAFVNIYKLVIV